MRTIPFLIAEAILPKILVKDIREAALGDLWEAHNHMRKEGKRRFPSQLVTAWRISLLLKASVQIYITRIAENSTWLLVFRSDDTLATLDKIKDLPQRTKPFLFSVTLISILFNVLSLDFFQVFTSSSTMEGIFNVGADTPLIEVIKTPSFFGH